MAELVLRQTMTESQRRHKEADADISSKYALLWPPQTNSQKTLSPVQVFHHLSSEPI